MAETYTEESHFDFSGGVDQSVGRLVMADNEVNWLENGETDLIGPISKVRGYTIRGTAVNNGYNILGMINAYRPSDGTQKQIVICDGASNSDAYTHDPINGVWTKNNLSLTTGSKAEFESFLNGFYMVNFTEATRFNDLNQWYTTTNVTNAAKAKYIKQYLSRIYLGYVVSGGTTYPSRVTYSDLPNGSPLATTWNDSYNYFDVANDDGDTIMALEVNANRLLVYKHDSLYRYDTNTLYQVPGCPGTVSQRSVRNIQGHTLYLHDTGIWDYNGESSSLISRKIKDIIDGISTKSLANANAWVKTDHYYLFVGDVYNSKTGLTINKCLIDYDIAKTTFAWRSLNYNPLDWMTYPDDSSGVTYNNASLTYNDANTTYNSIQSSEEKLYFGSDAGSVYQFDTGRNANGLDIPFSLETKDYYLGYPAYWKLMEKVCMFHDYSGKGRIKLQAKLDDKDWITLSPDPKFPDWFIFPAGSLCQRIRFKVTESSSGDRFVFEGLDIYYMPQGLIR
jgi:hypothetical protein